jgi:hypothetical protein
MPTAIIAFFFFFVVPIPHPAATQNVPAVCSAALERYRASAAAFNAENTTKFEQVFGRPVSAVDLPRECPAAIRFSKWKLNRARALMTAFNSTSARCANVGTNITVQGGGLSPQQIIAGIHAKLAQGGCHRVGE